MKRTFLLAAYFILVQFVSAQMLLPKFGEGVKVTEISTDKNEEGTPVFFNEGKSVYFSRTYFQGKGAKTQITGQEIWFSEKAGDKWRKPYRLFREGILKGQNSLVGTTKDGNRIYLLNTTFDEKTDSSIRKIIYIDQTKKDVWTEPTTVTIPGFVFAEKYANFHINNEETVILASVSPSDEVLSEDLFASLKDKNGNWGELINLGKNINTGRFEVYPYLSSDLKNIYFSSNGHRGFGGSDIFVSHRLDDTWKNWTKPLNMGEPINSGGYDSYFIIANNNDVYFTSNRESEHENIFTASSNGEFVFANANSISGIFYINEKIKSGKRLRIEDAEGNLIEQIVTDEEGKFKFKKLSGEENYLIKLDGDDTDLYEGSKIYFVDANGTKTKRYILSKEGIFVDAKKIEGVVKVNGVYKYKSLLSMRSGLIIFDENGFPLDTVYSDENGKFQYDFILVDDQFSIVPLNMTEDEFLDVDLYIVGETGNKLASLTPGKTQQIPKEIKDHTVLQPYNNEPRTGGIDLENPQGAEVEVAAWNGMQAESKRVYFDFKAAKLSANEKRKLSVAISIVKMDKTRKIYLTGHTDNVGTKENNIELGKERATAVKNYLVSKGIAEGNIVINSNGESNSIATNENEAGRAKNRRVEVEMK